MLSGKGMWIHKLKNADGGNCVAIAQAAQAAGITHVLVKILDGRTLYNMRPVVNQNGFTTWVDDLLQPFVTACHDRNVQVWGWQYVYLTDPRLEAERAIERVAKFGFDGFVIDAEGECKGQPSKAQTYCSALHGIGVPVALSTYRFPTVHPEFPWSKFLPAAEIYMPQVYWEGAHNPEQQLERTIREWRALTNGVIIPTGAAYYEHGWTAAPSETVAFTRKAEEMGFAAVNYWEWWFTRVGIPGMWAAIANYDYGGLPAPLPPETISTSQFVAEYIYPLMVAHWGYNGPKPEGAE